MGYQDGTLLPAWLVSPVFMMCCRAISITYSYINILGQA